MTIALIVVEVLVILAAVVVAGGVGYVAAFKQPGYNIPVLTAAYHQRRAEGDSLAVMTADEPDGALS